jgi:hypothetical protein
MVVRGQIIHFKERLKKALWLPGEVMNSGPFYKRLIRSIDCGALVPAKMSNEEVARMSQLSQPLSCRSAKTEAGRDMKTVYKTAFDDWWEDSSESCEKRVKAYRNGLFCSYSSDGGYYPNYIPTRSRSRTFIRRFDLQGCLDFVAKADINHVCMEQGDDHYRIVQIPSGFLVEPSLTFDSFEKCNKYTEQMH